MFLRVILLVLVIVVLTVVWMLADGLNDDSGRADVGLVADYSADRRGVADPLTKAALDRAVQLYNQGKFSTVVVSGIDSASDEEGTPAMSKYLQDHGVAPSQIARNHNAFTMLAMAHQLSVLMAERHYITVMVIAPYYETTRTKVALWNAGIGETQKVHVGTLEKEDTPDIARALTELYDFTGRYCLLPLAAKIRVEARDAWAKLQVYLHGMKTTINSKLDTLPK